jgi:hypothetical protein
MSHTTLLTVPVSGELYSVQEFGNSWGSAPRIWDALGKKYIAADWRMFPIDERLWKLATDERVDRCERLTLAFTFDRCICEMPHAKEMAALLREFDSMNPAKAGNVNHVPAVADALEKHFDADAIGFGLICTSVADDVWDMPDVCTEPFHNVASDDWCRVCDNPWADRSYRRPFDYAKDRDKDRHFMLFEQFGTEDAS